MDGVQGFEPLTATRQQRSAVCLTLSQLHIPRKQVSSLGRLTTHRTQNMDRTLIQALE